MKSSHRRLFHFTGRVRTIALEVRGLWSKWTRQRWGNESITKVIEWKVSSFMFLFVPFVFISNAIILFFIDEVFGWSY